MGTETEPELNRNRIGTKTEFGEMVIRSNGLRKRIAAIDLMPYNAYLGLIDHVVLRYNVLSRDNFNELMG